jgi:choline dehydrogenase-like flavoprotein
MPTTSPTAQITDFTRDVLGRYVCNGLDEARRSADPANPSARPFDVIVVGGGTFGSVLAQHLFFQDKQRSHRILVLEGGPFLLPEHVQNLPALGVNSMAPTSIADLRQAGQFGVDKPQAEVWGLPWHSSTKFSGLAYCIGGRSVYWGGWSPQLLPTETPLDKWPPNLVNDLNNVYFAQASAQIGVDVTNDFMFGELHKALRKVLFDGLNANKVADALPLAQLPLHLDPSQVKPGEEDLNKLEAPLAVQGNAPRAGFFPLNKFSAVPLLMAATRASWFEAGGDDVKRRLMAVPRCHVKRLVTVQQGATWRVTDVETNQGNIPVPPNGIVVIGLGTIESTRLALNSFQGIPTYNEIGKNLMAHLRSNLAIRIPRQALPNNNQLPPELQASALFVKGRHPINGKGGHFHLQITASGLGSLATDSEAELFRKVPDIDGFEPFRGADDKSVVITIRGIGEMEPQNPNSFVRLDPELDENGINRAFVSIQPSTNDQKVWDAMDKATDEVAKVFANGFPFEVFTPRGVVKADANSDLGKIVPYAPNDDRNNPGRRDSLGSTHHEAGTLRMGANSGQSVTDADGRFHDVPNAYVACPALFPTLGSPNPMLTGVAIARRTVDRFVPPPPPPEAGFTSLFDGTEATYKLWQTVGQGTFELIDGAMVVQTGGDLGLSYYPQAFGDFILRLQFRLDRIDDNSGVFVRSRNPRLAVPRRNAPKISDVYNNQAYVAVDTGFEIQIDELARGNQTKNPPEPDGMDKKRTGAIYDIPTTPGSIQQNFNRGPALQPRQWNDYEIEVKKSAAGDVYTVRLRGQQTTTYTNTDAYRGKSVQIDPDSGFLGLQSHTGRVAFRNIRIRA